MKSFKDHLNSVMEEVQCATEARVDDCQIRAYGFSRLLLNRKKGDDVVEYVENAETMMKPCRHEVPTELPEIPSVAGSFGKPTHTFVKATPAQDLVLQGSWYLPEGEKKLPELATVLHALRQREDAHQSTPSGPAASVSLLEAFPVLADKARTRVSTASRLCQT